MCYCRIFLFNLIECGLYKTAKLKMFLIVMNYLMTICCHYGKTALVHEAEAECHAQNVFLCRCIDTRSYIKQNILRYDSFMHLIS